MGIGGAPRGSGQSCSPADRDCFLCSAVGAAGAHWLNVSLDHVLNTHTVGWLVCLVSITDFCYPPDFFFMKNLKDSQVVVIIQHSGRWKQENCKKFEPSLGYLWT